MNRKSQRGLAGAIAFLLFVQVAAAYGAGETIYVDGSVTESGNGTSWEEAFKTVEEGMHALATVNAVSQGGHTVLIAAGKYIEEILELATAHAGVEGSNNVFLADGLVHIQGQASSTFRFLSGAQYLTLDGLLLSAQGRWGQVRFYSGSDNNLLENMTFESSYGGSTGAEIHILHWGGNFTVRNSVFRGQIRAAAIEQRSSATMTIENCLFWRNRTAVWARSGGGTINISDSIMVFNRNYGLLIDDAGATVNAERTLIYANGLVNAYFAGTGKAYDTEADFAELSQHANMDFSDIIVSNPGFADLHDDWNRTLFYDNSPVLMENSGFAGHLGPDQDLQTVPASSYTYYVNAGSGDDGRSPSEARSKNTPWLTIAKAAEHAIAGDTVIVKPGRYSGNATITSSGSGDLPLTYKADGEVFFESQLELNRTVGVVVDGFDFDTGRILLNSAFDAKIINCRIYDRNQAGISASGSVRTTVRDTVIHSCQYGIFHGDSGLLVDRCLVYSNDLRNIYADLSVHIVNSAVYDNESGANIALRHPTGFRPFPMHPSQIENSVVAGSPGIGIHNYMHNTGHNTDLHIVNTIIAGNHTGVYRELQSAAYDDTATIVMRHTCFHDNQVVNFDDFGDFYDTEEELNGLDGNENNIVEDPLFADAAFRLDPESPCIDAGTPETELETDFFGNPRRTGIAVDIGLYEVPPRPSMIIIR